jgi:hypothetical protein
MDATVFGYGRSVIVDSHGFNVTKQRVVTDDFSTIDIGAFNVYCETIALSSLCPAERAGRRVMTAARGDGLLRTVAKHYSNAFAVMTRAVGAAGGTTRIWQARCRSAEFW